MVRWLWMTCWEPILRYDSKILLESLRKTAGDFRKSSLISDWIRTENIKILNVSNTAALTHSVSVVTKLLGCGEGLARLKRLLPRMSGPNTIPDRFMWDLLWTAGHCCMFSTRTAVSLSSTQCPTSFSYHPGLVKWDIYVVKWRGTQSHRNLR
jgi:hypothetical protein